MAYDYTIKGNPLLSGYQAGSQIGGGLREAFSTKPAMRSALEQIAQGADPTTVLQQLAAQNPDAADMLAKQLQQQYQAQAAPVALESQQLQNQATEARLQDRQQRQNIIGDIAGDDPVMQLIKYDPEAAGLVSRYKREVTGEKRAQAAIPLMGILSVQNPQAQRRLLEDAKQQFGEFSPTLAGMLGDLDNVPDGQLATAVAPIVQMLGRTGFIPKDPTAPNKTANQSDYEYYVRLLEEDPEGAERFAFKAMLDPDVRTQQAGEQARAIQQGKDVGKRVGGFVDAAVTSIKNLPNINRAIDLLEQVSTGGYESMQKVVTDFFGTTPANEAEFAYLTGKTVLGQLKDTFGAQFTNEEAKRLENLEAGLGRSTAANYRILQSAKETAINAAKRGYQAALQSGDEFTAQEIARSLRDMGVNVGDGQPQGDPQQQSNGPRDFESEYFGGGV